MAADAASPWTVIRSRHVWRDRWVSLRADDCRTVDGVSIAPFYILEYPDWVQIVAVDRDERVILTRQYRHVIRVVSLELPTGAVEPGETPIQAAVRELREETGHAGGDWRYLGATSPNAATHANAIHVFLARGVVAGGSGADEPTERIEVVRTTIAAALAAATDGSIRQASHIAALAIARDHLSA